MPFIFNLIKNCQPRKPTNICIPTLVHYLVKYERFLGVSYIQIHQSTFTQSGWFNVLIGQWCVIVGCVDFFSCLENKPCQKTKGCILAKKGHGERQREEELKSRTGRVCYALFYVCIALKNLWFPSKWSIWNNGQPEKKCSHAQGIFLHEWKFLLYVFVLSMVLRLDAEHIENKPNVGRRWVY